MTRLKVASLFLSVGVVFLATSGVRAGGAKHPSARVLAVAKKWRLHIKPGTKFPVGMDLRMTLTGKKLGKVGVIRAKVLLPLGRKTCNLDVTADLAKGRYDTAKGDAQLKGTLSVRKVQSDCSLPGSLEKKIKHLKADLVLTLKGSTLCPKGEEPPKGACFTPDK